MNQINKEMSDLDRAKIEKKIIEMIVSPDCEKTLSFYEHQIYNKIKNFKRNLNAKPYLQKKPEVMRLR